MTCCDGARWKDRGSVRFILWGPGMYVQNLRHTHYFQLLRYLSLDQSGGPTGQQTKGISDYLHSFVLLWTVNKRYHALQIKPQAWCSLYMFWSQSLSKLFFAAVTSTFMVGKCVKHLQELFKLVLKHKPLLFACHRYKKCKIQTEAVYSAIVWYIVIIQMVSEFVLQEWSVDGLVLCRPWNLDNWISCHQDLLYLNMSGELCNCITIIATFLPSQSSVTSCGDLQMCEEICLFISNYTVYTSPVSGHNSNFKRDVGLRLCIIFPTYFRSNQENRCTEFDILTVYY